MSYMPICPIYLFIYFYCSKSDKFNQNFANQCIAPTIAYSWLTTGCFLAFVSLSACLWLPAAGRTGQWPPPVSPGKQHGIKEHGLSKYHA